ncbi:MAG: hypothetical protein N2V78_10255 [Methanophagales archaeon]|nr:hypothetical protein [Methanophagales archaeon]
MEISKSYGIQVAKLAGLPEEVIESAKSVLRRLENEVEKEGLKRKAEVETKKEYVVQLHPVVEELKSINLEEISPIEALNKLYKMKKMLMRIQD